VLFKYLCAVLFSFIAIGLASANNASASTYFYSMAGTLSDGGSASGTFSIDWSATSGSLNISSLTITDPIVSGTVLNLQSQTSFGLCSGQACAPFHLNANLGSASLGINLAFSSPDSSGAISLLPISSFSRITATRFSPFVQSVGDFTSASIVPITQAPIPAALPLFAGGLGLLSLFGWRNGRKILVQSTARCEAICRL